MEDIALLLPTRQRPEMLKRLYNSAFSLANHPAKIHMVIHIDNDDDTYGELNFYNLEVIRGERDVLSKLWNNCYDVAKLHSTIFMHCGDDIIFRTEGWDDVVRTAFNDYEDKILFVFGDDGSSESNKNDFGTHGFIHRNWVETVGYFVPPYFVSDYNDTFLNDVSKKIGRHHPIPILTEHMHYSLGKMEIDQNTRDRLDRHAAHHPQDAYNSPWFKAEMEQKREALMKFIEDYHG